MRTTSTFTSSTSWSHLLPRHLHELNRVRMIILLGRQGRGTIPTFPEHVCHFLHSLVTGFITVHLAWWSTCVSPPQEFKLLKTGLQSQMPSMCQVQSQGLRSRVLVGDAGRPEPEARLLGTVLANLGRLGRCLTNVCQ